MSIPFDGTGNELPIPNSEAKSVTVWIIVNRVIETVKMQNLSGSVDLNVRNVKCWNHALSNDEVIAEFEYQQHVREVPENKSK